MAFIKKLYITFMVMVFIVLSFLWFTQSKEINQTLQGNNYICHSTFAINGTTHDITNPTIYFITPTYQRREQTPELTRLGHTLMHIPNLHWILADDNHNCNNKLLILLEKLGISFTYIASPMPEIYRKANIIPRGVANRRAAIGWIRKNVKNGIMYFGDDDNTFDLKLFDEIRFTKKVSMFPVGLIGNYAISSPVVKEGKVIGFFDSWPAHRKFPVDMAGFAVNIEFLLKHPLAQMPYKAGSEEDLFLKSLKLEYKDIEPKANLCTEILVWHTQTKKIQPPILQISSHLDTSLKQLLEEMEQTGLVKTSRSKGLKGQVILI